MRSTEVTFAPYRSTDRTAVCELHARSFAALAGNHNSATEIAAHIALIRGDDYPAELAANNLVVARNGSGTPVGTAGWCIHDATTATARIRKVFVAPSVAGTGLGRRLVEYVEDTARANGFRAFYVRANANAEGFYARLGYRRTGEGRMPAANGVSLPVVFMEKR